ncbi:MAG: S1C family serine protease, partial [Acidimicrobiia bacterium]|nr:S1C family serine protease [Acidimicrobiia bacterium]
DVGAEGLGFAVPVDLVQDIAADLLAEGEVRHAFLGISGRPAFSSDNGVEIPIGAEILSLTDNSAIGDAGAEPGDVIVSLAGEPVGSMNLLVTQLRSFRAGQTVAIGLLRDGTPIELSLTLDQRPEN